MYEGLSAFKEPISRITPNLYLGDSVDAQSVITLAENGITSIICLREFGAEVIPKGIRSYRNIPLIDGAGNDPKGFISAVAVLKSLIQVGEVVLVHCHMGISRSPTVVATYLAEKDFITFDKAVERLVKIRPVVEPHKALRKLAREYLGETK